MAKEDSEKWEEVVVEWKVASAALLNAARETAEAFKALIQQIEQAKQEDK